MSAPGVLVIVQNLPVPLDRRVWQECHVLARDGVRVSVICPKGRGDPSRQEIDGISIYKYAPAPQADGLPGYCYEFAYCWLRTAWLSLVARRNNKFSVVQACNPPDTYWLLAQLWKLCGVQFVFDQHDLNPELFVSRFGQPKGLGQRAQYRTLLFLERMTYRVSQFVISTNESYRRIAMRRGHKHPDELAVVRSGPDTTRMRPVYSGVDHRHGADHLLAYIGIMGPQDGVENLLEVMHILVHERRRPGVRAALLGFGDCLEALKQRCSELDLDDHVEFTGQVAFDEIAEYLSQADVGVCPDLATPLNDVSTMNKTMEYMAYCLPSVSFDLVETRISAGDTALFVPSGDLEAFADAVERLLDDDDLRASMGVAARERVASELDWSTQAEVYRNVYRQLLGWRGVDGPAILIGAPDDRDLVPLDDAELLGDFVRFRPTTATL